MQQPSHHPHIFPHDRIMERTVLRAIPSSITPNQVTWFRVILTPIVFFLILYKYYRFGIPLFLIAAFTDVIDGSLARTRDKVTEWGKLFDPLADKLLISSLVIILAFRYLDPYLVGAVLGLEIVFIIMGFLQWKSLGRIRGANWWGKVKMITQCAAVFLVLMALLFEFPLFLAAAQWLFGLAVGFAIMSLFSHGL